MFLPAFASSREKNKNKYKNHKKQQPQRSIQSTYRDVQRELKRAGRHVDKLEGDAEADLASRWDLSRPQFGLTRSMFKTAAEFRIALLKEEKKQMVAFFSLPSPFFSCKPRLSPLPCCGLALCVG